MPNKHAIDVDTWPRQTGDQYFIRCRCGTQFRAPTRRLVQELYREHLPPSMRSRYR